MDADEKLFSASALVCEGMRAKGFSLVPCVLLRPFSCRETKDFRHCGTDQKSLSHSLESLPALHPLLAPPPGEPKKEIGFHMKEDAPPYRAGRKTAKRI
jgi:hypothetical protein